MTQPKSLVALVALAAWGASGSWPIGLHALADHAHRISLGHGHGHVEVRLHHHPVATGSERAVGPAEDHGHDHVLHAPGCERMLKTGRLLLADGGPALGMPVVALDGDAAARRRAATARGAPPGTFPPPLRTVVLRI